MRILIVCYVHPPEVAPAGVMVRELAEDLAAEGHQVTVLTGWPNHPRGRLFPGFRLRWRQVERDGRHRLVRVAHAIRPKASPAARLWVYLTFAVSSLLNGLTIGRQDVVVCLSTPLFGVWTAWAMARLWRARFVNVIFDLWPEAIHNAGLIRADHPAYRLARRLDTLNCLWSDGITTLGEGIRGQIAARGVPLQRIRVIPFWIDTEKVRPLSRLNAWRAEQGIPPEQFVVLFAGTIGYASGAGMLAATAEALAGRPDILLLVVGEGVAKEELQRLACQRGVRNLRFLPFQPEPRLAEMQSAADVGLVSLLPQSGISSVPSKVLGYMAAGRAVIASAPGDTDTARLIERAGCGLVAPAQDSPALARAIASLADDRRRAEELGRRARRYAEEHFSRPAVVRQYRDAILGQEGERGGAGGQGPDAGAGWGSPIRRARRWWAAKYAVEWLLALIATAALLPLLAALAVLVKLTSRGPALYTSPRLGKGGRVFRLYKFRSMRVGAEQRLAADGKVITLERDPRFTPIGRFLRLGFDELPQLLNVLKGRMCLIGPRPDVPWELERYSPRQHRRLHVVPGITGLTQVLGGRELNNAQNYELDVRYVERSSAWLDVLVFLLTLPYALGARQIARRMLREFLEGLDELADEDHGAASGGDGAAPPGRRRGVDG